MDDVTHLKIYVCRIQGGGQARGLQILCARRGRGSPLSVLCLCGVCLSHRNLAFVESPLALHMAVTKYIDAVHSRFSRTTKGIINSPEYTV